MASWLEAYAVALEQRETAKDAYTSSVARLHERANLAEGGVEMGSDDGRVHENE
ncbi:MAG: hypothetical protein Q7S40_21795 [Opitutaceae bacterium]|nr:hypothetical protein [Opitutaceae bacterium]